VLSSNSNNIALGHSPVSSGSAALVAIIFAVVCIIVYFFTAFVLSKIFHKANRKKSLAYIPVYNYWILFEIAGLPGWLVFLYILSVIPIIGYLIAFILGIILAVKLAKKFNKSMVFTIFGLIIFNVVGYLMLAFGKAQYNTSDVPPTGGGTTPNQLDQATTQSPQNDLSSNIITPNMNVTSDVPPAVVAEPNQVYSDSLVNQTIPNVDVPEAVNPMSTNDPVVISNPMESSNEAINNQPSVINTDNMNQVNPTDNLAQPAEDSSSSNSSPSFPAPENQSTETQDSSQSNF